MGSSWPRRESDQWHWLSLWPLFFVALEMASTEATKSNSGWNGSAPSSEMRAPTSMSSGRISPAPALLQLTTK
jgi:hypothetical protein